MKTTQLIMFLGAPGSGKSTFARQLAIELKAVRLNGDAMRFALYGSVEGIDQARQNLGRDEVNRQTFGALNYSAEQILSQSQSVIYDARRNKKSERQTLQNIAIKNRATPVIVWMKTPDDTASDRTMQRTALPDQPKYDKEELKLVTERHITNFEEPTNDEPIVVIDGTQEFRLQYKSFLKQQKSISKRLQ